MSYLGVRGCAAGGLVRRAAWGRGGVVTGARVTAPGAADRARAREQVVAEVPGGGAELAQHPDGERGRFHAGDRAGVGTVLATRDQGVGEVVDDVYR